LPGLYFRLYLMGTNFNFNLDAYYRDSWRTFFFQQLLWLGYIYIYKESAKHEFSGEASLFVLSFILIYFVLSRIAISILLIQLRKLVRKPFNVAIWGFNKTSIELAAEMEHNSYFINFLGIINHDAELDFQNTAEFNLALYEAIHKASARNIQELYVVVQPAYIEDLNSFFELADNYCIRLKFVPDFSMLSKGELSASNFNQFHILIPRHEPLQNSYNRLLKRVFDIVFSLLVIVFVLSWLYPILAFLIKKQSPGPVLFKQLRTGKKNQAFWCYKFRSMQTNAQSDSLQAQKGDVRVTTIGRFLRKTSLDELPQFYNVLLGEMSIVGPRPHMLQHTLDYNHQINNFMVRHFVKPGITGLAQVSGYRGETKTVRDMQRRVKADIAYVQNWSLPKDIKICFLTIIVSLKGDDNAF